MIDNAQMKVHTRAIHLQADFLLNSAAERFRNATNDQDATAAQVDMRHAEAIKQSVLEIAMLMVDGG